MKSPRTFHWRTLFLAITVILSVSAAATKSKVNKSNTFENPDFAFPKTVIANADKALSDALRDGNSTSMVKAVIQLTSAANALDRSQAPSAARRIDSIAAIADRATAAILYSLEAELYAEMYRADAYKYNGRSLPASDTPDDPYLWDKDMYGRKVCGLLWQSLSPSEILLGTPLADYSKLLKWYDRSNAPYYTSLYQLLLNRAARIAEPFIDTSATIPFGAYLTRVPRRRADALRLKAQADTAVSYFNSRKDYFPLSASVRTRADIGATDVPYLLAWADSLADSEAAGLILSRLASTPYAENRTTAPDFLNRARRYAEKYPDAPASSRLCNAIISRTRAHISFEMSDRFISSDSVRIKAILRNTPDMYLLAYPVSEARHPRRLAELIAGRNPVASVYVRSASSDTVCVAFSPLAAGSYVVVPSRDPKGASLFKEYLQGSPWQGRFTVGSLMWISMADTDGGNAIFVGDGRDMHPVEGASVTLTSYRKNVSPLVLTTDSRGIAKYTSELYSNCTIRARGELIEAPLSQAYASDSRSFVERCMALYTDRGLYRPADTLQFAGIGYEINTDGSMRTAPAKSEYLIDLIDVNGNTTDSVRVAADSYGRVSGSLRIPASGLLGSFAIRARNASRSDTRFEVAEYKLPTFFVTTDSISGGDGGKDIRITGTAATYSGMPLANAEIRFNIECRRSLWRSPYAFLFDPEGASFGSTVTTDSNGRYSIDLPTSSLAGTPYANAMFNLEISATSAAGETQSAPSRVFSTGSTMIVEADIPALIELGGKQAAEGFKTEVTDMLGNRLNRDATYTLYDGSGSKVASGTVANSLFRLPADIRPGRYRLTLAPDSASDASTARYSFTLYSPKSIEPPYATPLWTVRREVKGPAGSKARIDALTSYADSWIAYEVSDGRKALRREVVQADGTRLPIEVTIPRAGESLHINIFACHDLKTVSESITVIPEAPAKLLTVKAVSFRDKVNAPSTEKWSFRFTQDGVSPGEVPAMLTVTNAALDALNPFSWQMPSRPYTMGSRPAFNIFRTGRTYASGWLSGWKAEKTTSILPPEIYRYGQSLFGSHSYYSVMVRGSHPMYLSSAGAANEMKVDAAPARMAAKESVESEAMEDSAETTADTGSAQQQDSKKPSYRPAEMPLAMFAPKLTSGADGTLDVEFHTPDYNTTWRLQLLGYTSDMRGARLESEFTASKPVMVQTSIPRFVRTGDRATIAATVSNASDSIRSVSLTFSVGSMQEIHRTLELKPRTSAAVNLEFEAPGMPGQLIVRAMATSGEFADGEQTPLPVLPSTQTVASGKTFYLAPGEQRFSLTLTDFKADAEVTLQYCDNPVWYCLTALPDISVPESASVLSLADALYASAIGSNLAAKYPEIRRAAQLIAADTTGAFASPLEKYKGISGVSPSDTPWQRTASAESSRSRAIGRIADGSAAKSAAEYASRLVALQNADGGWSWCPGMKSSAYITQRVLSILAGLTDFNAMPDASGLSGAISDAVAYCDIELARKYRRSPRSFDSMSALDYLYTRSLLSNNMGPVMKKISSATVSAIRSGWRSLGIYNAATAALFMHRSGQKATARTIMESLLQKSVYTPEGGRHYANLDAFTPLIATARVIEASSVINPQSESVDQLRQWLLLTRQTESWTSGGRMPEVIGAVLSTGSDWTRQDTPAVVSIGGTPLATDSIAALTGEITVRLDAARASGQTLSVDRSAPAPAWGGVTSRYVEPIADIDARGSSQLRVSKHLYRVEATPDGEIVSDAPIRPGDKVKVVLEITADRNLDYVAVTDNRSAALEPDRQLSGYTGSDGLWYYMETRDAVTNLYIPRLTKGAHVVAYYCHATRPGDYASGSAEAISLYAPAINAGSAGANLNVRAN